MGYVSLAQMSVNKLNTWRFQPDVYKTFVPLLTCFVQMRLMGECRGSIDAVKRAEGELAEDGDVPGLTNPTDAQGSGQGSTRSSHAHVHTSPRSHRLMLSFHLQV